MLSARGSKPFSRAGWRRVGKQFLTASGSVAIPATTTATVASPGLILKWQPGQAIYIRRYVSGAAAAAAANLILYFHGSLEVQTGSQPFSVGSGNGSNDSEMLSGDPSPSVANAQTLSDISITAMLRDDWHEFDDYINPVAGVGLGLQCFWRLRNVDAAAHNVTVVDSVLLEIWQSESALLGDARA